MTAYAARMGLDTFGLRTVRTLCPMRIGDTPRSYPPNVPLVIILAVCDHPSRVLA